MVVATLEATIGALVNEKVKEVKEEKSQDALSCIKQEKVRSSTELSWIALTGLDRQIDGE